MSNNLLTDRFAQGEIARGAWLAVPSSISAEIVARTGVDYCCVDMQHGAVGYSDAIPMMQAVRAEGVTPLVRVSANDMAEIGRALDAGAQGVVVPLVSTPEQAAEAAAACRYPPRGVRSFGPIRASVAAGSSEIDALEQVLCAVMVETDEGLANVEAIAATPGVGAIYVGPADLSLALGLPPKYEHDDPTHESSIQRIRKACESAGIVAGIHCADGDMARRRLAQGFRMVTVANDAKSIGAAVAAELAAAVASSD
ncbi:4-hydroxy-2-oxoheptanedioate aldolase [Ilumatobacter fluminis]|uniref:4-hydroxy-2-oxoheptanedioate aldolase n=1 Tax=Ilumatobacter fluminis TaxID=467091 RepID=A0A4R7HUC6_9ACTN|nr:aldolase/citrate lyase family protein [Ilumatobacter fluminis]TDT14541.1 4-hydroxy-2-oxoheptanedioate aldolase [Ilumatobacter fluminis]